MPLKFRSSRCDTHSVRKGILAGVLAAAVGVALTAAPAPAVTRKPHKVVYLTFDDGPNSGNDPRLLRILRREQVPATFFVVGQSLTSDRDFVKRLYLAGHAIGNHSWAHADLTTMSSAGVAATLRSTQRLIGPVGGACMRPPYGAVSPAVVAEVNRLGMRMVLWDVDPQDWAHQDSVYITNHVLSHVRDRSVVLLHDGGGPRSATTTAVKTIIPVLKARGYEFRTVPACRVPIRMDLLDAGIVDEPTPVPTPQPVSPSPTASAPTDTPVVP